MNHIYFNNRKNFKSIVLLLIGLLLILIGFYKSYLEGNDVWSSGASVLGYLFFGLHFSKMFWHKNYVEWNKKGIVYKIKTRFGKTIRFNRVGGVVLKKDILFVTMVDGAIVEIDLHGICPEDQAKLQGIFTNKGQ